MELHVRDLYPDIPKKQFKEAFTDVVKHLVGEDPKIKVLAQRLADEVDGVGFINALKVLAGCGMLINEHEKKASNE